MPLVHDRCICLRKTEYSETSQILTLFSRRYGVFRAIAKGAHRRTKAGASKFDGGIDFLEVGDAVFTHDPARDLATLTEWCLPRGTPGVAAEPARHVPGPLRRRTGRPADRRTRRPPRPVRPRGSRTGRVRLAPAGRSVPRVRTRHAPRNRLPGRVVRLRLLRASRQRPRPQPTSPRARAASSVATAKESSTTATNSTRASSAWSRASCTCWRDNGATLRLPAPDPPPDRPDQPPLRHPRRAHPGPPAANDEVRCRLRVCRRSRAGRAGLFHPMS